MAGATFTRYDASSYARVAAMKKRSRAGSKPAMFTTILDQ
jgi:hypothetical protein